jgi:hypothetical protein
MYRQLGFREVPVVVENDMAERRKRASAIVGQSDNELGSCYVAATEFIIADCGSLCARWNAAIVLVLACNI